MEKSSVMHLHSGIVHNAKEVFGTEVIKASLGTPACHIRAPYYSPGSTPDSVAHWQTVGHGSRNWVPAIHMGGLD